jgi:hypothetical protein
MRRIALTVCIAAFLFAGHQSAQAQGCTSESPTVGNCFGSGGCEGMYSIPPICDGSGFAGCGSLPLQCCGRIKQVYNDSGCDGAPVARNPFSRQALDEFARNGIEVAVVQCNKHLTIYRPSALEDDLDLKSLRKPLLLLPTGF